MKRTKKLYGVAGKIEGLSFLDLIGKDVDRKSALETIRNMRHMLLPAWTHAILLVQGDDGKYVEAKRWSLLRKTNDAIWRETHA